MITILHAVLSAEPTLYGWIIDRDLTGCQPLTERVEGMRGPRGICDDLAAELASRRNGRPFHLYGGDKLLFSGRLLSKDGSGELAPLEEFGSAYGCTRIEYED